MAESCFRSFSDYCREHYGEVAGKLAIDLGVPCPNRSRGGCIFCNPRSFAPGYLQTGATVAEQLTAGKMLFLKGRFRKYFLYFQQESCTAAPLELLLSTLADGLREPACLGAILAVRPDGLDADLLSEIARQLEAAGKKAIFELGLQSAHQETLDNCNRNHQVADFLTAARLIGDHPCLELGAHLLLGLPGESPEMMQESLRLALSAGVSHLKLHHLQVVRDTPLQQRYDNGELRLFELEEYLQLLLALLAVTPPHITFHRLWASCPPELLIAPRWQVLAAELSKRLQARMQEKNLRQGCGLAPCSF